MKLTDIKGIGPKKQEKLNSMGIYDVRDFIEYLPRYYEDRSNLCFIANAVDGEKNYFELKIEGLLKTYFYKKNMSISRLIASDSTGQINLVWYNDRFSGQNLKVGQTYKFFGKFDKAKNQLMNPIFAKLNEDYIGGIYPIYSIIKGFSKKEFIQLKDIALGYTKPVEDYLNDEILKENNMFELNQMFYILHKPKNYIDLLKAKQSQIIRELITNELSYRNFTNTDEGHIKFSAISLNKYIKALDFDLTESQNNVISEIAFDMYQDKRMNRIIIGDVGSGKTIVAVMAAIIAVKNGYQVAFMAPTELLALQHFKNYREFLSQFDIRTDIILGSTKNKDRKLILNQIYNGDINIVFGTHSLFQDKVNYKNLGLVITDEQQRFGVYQRKQLADKGLYPDLLLLSATPIPRTLALTMYRDLDFSIIDRVPSNRQPIESYLVSESYERRFLKFATEQITKGRQVYVVCPRVNDDGSNDINSVERIYSAYKKYLDKSIRVDYIHGQMDVDKKIEKQTLFANGKIDILIATTIVEVGIDVKNANTMIIYNANNFGLSQLHQLRGRVGRGNYQSYCIFVASKGKENDEKLKFLADNNNGFDIARKDLELRGAGDRLGLFQSGYSDDILQKIYDSSIYERVNKIVDYIEANDLTKNRYLLNKLEEKQLEHRKIILN